MGNYRSFLQGPLPVANYTRIIIPGRFWTRPPSIKNTRMASSATPLHDSLIELAIPDAHAHAIKWYLKFLLFFSSIIAEGQQQERCGFSVWWTHLKHLHWDTWRLYPVGMLQPSCPSYKLILHQTSPFDQISGQHTIGSAQFQE